MNTTQEYGIFNDEGCVERQFWSSGEAAEFIADNYDEEDGLEVRELCPDHDEQPYDACEECYADA